MDKIKVESSAIEGIKHSGEQLVVYFTNGSTYVYSGVSEKVVEDFLAADSKGRYFISNVKDRYPYVKI